MKPFRCSRYAIHLFVAVLSLIGLKDFFWERLQLQPSYEETWLTVISGIIPALAAVHDSTTSSLLDQPPLTPTSVDSQYIAQAPSPLALGITSQQHGVGENGPTTPRREVLTADVSLVAVPPVGSPAPSPGSGFVTESLTDASQRGGIEAAVIPKDKADQVEALVYGGGRCDACVQAKSGCSVFRGSTVCGR